MPIPGLMMPPGLMAGGGDFPKLMGSPGLLGAGTTSAVVPLPSGIVAGEILLIVFAIGADTNRTITVPSGWTALRDVAGTTVRRWVILYRIANGSEGASVTIPVSGSGSPGCVAISRRISGFSGVPHVPASPAQSTSAAPNPPALSPSGGAGRYLWIAAAGYRNSNPPSSYPTNFEGGVHSGWGSDDNVSVAMAVRFHFGGTIDPGAFEVPSSYWWADTIAIKGA